MKLYRDILELREMADKQKKGYLFEQAIREIQPWDYKPPISALARSEQFDGIYTWKGITFLIESKAKIGEIKAGSHDWEDFELKISKRKGKGVIGIFCSLYKVNNRVFESAKELNIRGGEIMVFDGDFWEDLAENEIEFEVVLEYMIPQIRLNNNSKPPQIKKIISWAVDSDKIRKNIFSISSKSTAKFLRRYKHKYHDATYVERDVDNLITQYLNKLKPTVLRKIHLEKGEPPKQIIVLRDVSGAGKTTLTVNFANNNNSLCIAGSCKDTEIDSLLSNFIDKVGDDKIIPNLNTLNKPLLLVFDSLDESKKHHLDKRQEIIGLLNYLKELNKKAQESNLSRFPVLILFTVREDYWRDWENLFEDRNIKKITKRYSTFQSSELVKAIKKYSNAYNYKIANKLSRVSEKTLSHPINLSIFSESHEFEGLIEVEDIWQEKILHKYFERKKDDTLKHPIPNLTGTIFMKIVSELAMECIEVKENGLSESLVHQILKSKFSVLEHYFEELLLLLRSEHILIKEIEDKVLYRFRHSKFLEYLCAFHIVNSVHISKSIDLLEGITDKIFRSGVTLMWSVHDCIRYISKTGYSSTYKLVDDFYASSEKFMGRKVLHLRSNISIGRKATKEDLELILKNSSSGNKDLNFECFFVISAINNEQDSKKVIQSFLLGWRNNIDRVDRWKMLTKIKQHQLLFDEKILSSIVTSTNSKEWEVYLGFALENSYNRIALKQLILSEGFLPNEFEEEDWQQVKYLVNIIKNDKEYIKGSVNR